MSPLLQKALQPVDNSPLVAFRIIFGFLITLEAWGAIITGWVKRTFIDPEYTFPFLNFEWLQPLPGNGMLYYFIIMGFAGVMTMLGWHYRIAIGTYAVMWAGVYFMQKFNYNNHYYLLLLLLCLMWIAPAHRYASVDAARKPGLKKLTCPRWCLWVFIAQIAIVYAYAAIAKMYPDWLSAKPIAIWFGAKKDYFLMGPLLQETWFQYLVAYGGIAFDLLIVPTLLWKKTRKAAFVISIFFHLFNSAIFQVGIFPYLGISWALFFFPPETIRKFFFKRKPAPDDNEPVELSMKNKFIVYGLCIYMLFQIVLPLRHHFYPGVVNWTEQGHRLSWRMMLRAKTGHVVFNVIHPPTGQQWTVRPKEYLTSKQARLVAYKPDMCWQFVQLLKKDFVKRGFGDVEIYASGSVTLNGGPSRSLYNPEVDLAKVPWTPFAHADWLMLYE